VTTLFAYRTQSEADITAAMQTLVSPGRGYLGCTEVLGTLVGASGCKLQQLASLPLGDVGHRLMALRYFLINGPVWMRHFAWEPPLARVSNDAADRVRLLASRVEAIRASMPSQSVLAAELATMSSHDLARRIEQEQGQTDEGIRILLGVSQLPALATGLRERLRAEAQALHQEAPRVLDILYLASWDLSRLPATTVGEGDLRYLIVADKGEMGVRAVRECVAFGAIPVVLYSTRDDAGALQVRLAERQGGFGVPLEGTFRETYGNPVQIAEQIHAVYAARFGSEAQQALARSALYPGYGPLAENTAAIEHFRHSGIVFVGPMQDVVERAGDKRQFRLLAQAIDEHAVVPGIVLDDDEPMEIVGRIRAAHKAEQLRFPGRLKAANGGGGRGQVIVESPERVPSAVQKVLAEIAANGWDPGVMFEQNIAETIHLEVQVLRDRYGNTRHFGMRDCTEQRASQKIQEEAPPALLRAYPGLTERICELAVRIADQVGYVGACTVELMFKDGHCYLLEMNTRIQVEHPVTEAAHRIRTPEGLEPLNLVNLQFAIAAGAPIAFAQEDVVNTHVAREFRINAESWKPSVKDSRDGKLGMFVPNAGIFDVIELPSEGQIVRALETDGVHGIRDLQIRFDCGFEPGDTLVNKDPTFGKLIVAIAADQENVGAHTDARYELLRRASIEVLRTMRIEGRQVLSSGKIIEGSRFEINCADHIRVLESEIMHAHSHEPAPGRHVGWVVEMLRRVTPPTPR
jgi:acetyl/propionyl-CoA carboxylase alpha subunit